MNCEQIRDVYPDVLSGTADAALAQQVRAHLAACDECREETALLESLRMAEVPLPAGLHQRVISAARMPERRRYFSRGGIAMAATLAAAVIGGSLLLDNNNRPVQQGEQQGFGFVSVKDAMMSGTSSLEDLSVEELEKLLGEMES